MHSRLPLALSSVIAIALVGLVATPAQAANFTASTEVELVDRINEANGNSEADTITLTGTGFTLTGNLPAITETLTIVGPGSGSFTLNTASFVGFSSTGSGTNTAFDLSGITIETDTSVVVSTSNIDVELNDLVVGGTIEHDSGDFSAVGVDVTEAPNSAGFSILVGSDDTVVVNDVSVTGTFFEGIYIVASGTSTVAMSDVTVQASGLDFYDGASVTVNDSASLTVTDSEFSDNRSDGIEVNANNTSSVLIDRVTANENWADGIDVDADDDSTATIRNSSAARNDDNGFESDFHGGSGSFTNVTAEDNSEHGYDIEADQGGQIIVTNAVALDNGARGLMVEPDTADSTITVIGGRAEGNGGHGLYLNVDQGTAISDGFVTRDNDDGGVLIDGYNGQATLRNAVVEGNNASTFGSRGGIHIVAYDDGDGPLDVIIDRTTISGNGDVGVSGTLFDGSTALIVNSTMSGNTAETGGAIELEGDVESELTIAHSTITLNQSTLEDSAAVVVEGMLTVIDHTIISGNTGGAGTVDLQEFGADLTIDYSLVGTADAGSTVALTAGTGNIVGQPAGLGPLADNGGPTRTHLPLAGSPAIGAGNPAIAGAPATDQRGEDRVAGVIEIGSVEIQSPELAATGASESIATLAAGIALLIVLGGSLLMVARRRSMVTITR